MASEIRAQPFEPLEAPIPGGIEYSYIEYDRTCPVIQLRDLRRDRNGNLTCELTAFCMETGIMMPVAGIRWNLSSLTTRKHIAQGIKEAYLETSATWIEWGRILADAALRALKFYRNGHDIEEIWPLEEIPKPAFLVEPLLPKDQPTIVFGDGGTGKGHVAMTAGLLAQLPYTDNKLGLIVPPEPTNTLYLDYESDHTDFQRTLTGLCMGFGINIGLKRLQMAVPIPECIEQLKNKVNTDKIGFLIVDSLAPAAGGNINDAEPAIRLFGALRQLENVTTLIIAHNSKDPLSKTKSVFGSVFFTNLARSVWEIKKSQETDSPEMIIGLKHKKYNRRHQLPIGLRYTFNDDNGSITVARQDLSATELSSELPLYLQIKDLLLNGSMTKAGLAEALNRTEAEIKPTLYKYKKLFINMDGGTTWGVVANGGSY